VTPQARTVLRALAFPAAVAAGLLLFLRTAMPFAVSPGPLALNHVQNTPRLASAGMPTRAQFQALAAAGVGVVVNLAPTDVLGAHDDEQALVEQQGMRYVHIPVNFTAPAIADYERVAQALRESGDGRVLVHCQISLRASTFVFLYRVLELGEDPDAAFDDVVRVWQPNTQWREFIRETLASRGMRVPFELSV
jgi:protein tyrosine phosphatase (PTP) superfamily phosphohydrolase (DUF442 family)